MTYEEELQILSGQVGERNKRLLTIALKGHAAGRDAETMIGEIIAASGTPPLAQSEVRRAVKKAMEVAVVRRSMPPMTPKYRPEKRRGNPLLKRTLHAVEKPTSGRDHTPSSAGRYSFVREMIERGGGSATSAELIALSPTVIPKEPWVQAAHFCMMLEEGESELYFTGTPRMKRSRERLKTLNDLKVCIMDAGAVADTHILPNDLTGRGVMDERGVESFARESCVGHARHTVIEFDGMPLNEQAAFWKGVITCAEKPLLPLRALVYSGGKSIHGLLRLDEKRGFREQWSTLERFLANDLDPRYRCDTAFRSPVQMMRFPGALRPETHRYQKLLYLD